MTRIAAWFQERLPISGEQLRELTNEPVPNHLKRWWFCLGGTPPYLFVVQIVTGILLAVYYQPSPAAAYESVRYITQEAAFGWYIRGVHKWGATLMIAAVVLHQMRVFFTGAFRKPREINWMIGMTLLFTTLITGFTGYSLVYEAISRNASSQMTFGGGRRVNDVLQGVGGCQMAIDRTGSVTVAWQWFDVLRTDVCAGGGTICGSDVSIPICQIRSPLEGGFSFKTTSLPSLAIANPPGSSSEMRYLVWADARNPDGTCPVLNKDRGNANIYMTRSLDGVTWLPPRAIASDPVDEFFPSVYANASGFVHVIYYKRTAQNARRLNLVEIVSGDWGDTFSAPTQINDGGVIVEPAHSPFFIGDYIAIDGVGSDLTRHVAWFDSRRPHEYVVGQQGDIYTAKLSGC